MDDATAANTYANAVRPSDKPQNVDDVSTPTVTMATTVTTDQKGASSPVTPPTRHKDSTVGFR